MRRDKFSFPPCGINSRVYSRAEDELGWFSKEGKKLFDKSSRKVIWNRGSFLGCLEYSKYFYFSGETRNFRDKVSSRWYKIKQ